MRRALTIHLLCPSPATTDYLHRIASLVTFVRSASIFLHTQDSTWSHNTLRLAGINLLTVDTD